MSRRRDGVETMSELTIGEKSKLLRVDSRIGLRLPDDVLEWLLERKEKEGHQNLSAVVRAILLAEMDKEKGV